MGDCDGSSWPCDGSARATAGDQAGSVSQQDPTAESAFASCCETDRLIIRLLVRMGWKPDDLRSAIHLARRDAVSLEEAVLSLAKTDRRRWTEILSAESGLPMLSRIDPAGLVLPAENPTSLLSVPWQEIAIGYRLPDGRIKRLIPDSVGLAHNLPDESRDDVRLVSGPELRRALLSRLAYRIEDRASNELFSRAPELSARRLTNTWQSFALGALFVLFIMGMAFTPALVMLAVHILSSSFFLSCMILRLFALPYAGSGDPRLEPLEEDEELPVYTVLVALYREAEMAGQLLTALGRLRWPRGKLEIRFICEADDRQTIEAIEVLDPPANVEILQVPAGVLRTKPRALNFALPTCRGEYVCLYDAEDRPHPDQLLEAWQTFRRSPENVGCLQAPLIVTNAQEHWLARQFAFEYAALFRGVLRLLAAWGSILPLGGTSNHFRRSALDEVGAWDPYNVTEDADLGIRLRRAGYRAGVINAPTLEDAPVSAANWLPQRTRWLKGWMVCWLVHNRHPIRLWRELGPRSFLVSQILMAGIPGAALLLPLMLVSTLWLVARLVFSGDGGSPFRLALHAVDLTNLVLCMSAYWWLGTVAGNPRERPQFSKAWHMVPPYWLFQSVAAWRAVWQLVAASPHNWEKTEHKPTIGPMTIIYAPASSDRKRSASRTTCPSGSPIASALRPS